MSKSGLESTFALQLRINDVPEPVREFRPVAQRRWAVDFAWPDVKAAVEIEGGVWSGGRHTRGDGFTKDCEKYNELVLRGWRLLRVTGEQVEDGSAVHWVMRLLGIRQGEDAAPF